MTAKMVSTATTFISILLLAGLLANEAFQNYPTRPLASSFLHSSFRIQKSPSSLLVASAASAERSLETQTGSINYSSSPNNIADNDGNSQTTLQNKKQRQNHDNGNNSQSSSTTKATSTSIQDLKLASSSPTALAKLQRYKSTKALESSIMKLGRMGKFEEALELYFGVWFVDGWRVKERQREQKRKNNSSDSTVPATNDDKQQQQQQQTKIINAISPQLRPTTRLMNLAIDACARANPVQQQMAFDLFRDATAEGALSPNVFTFGSLLASFARNGDIDASLTLLDTLEKGIEYPDVIPNGVIYSTVISACERSNPPRVGLALELLNNATLALSLGGGGSSGSGNRSSSSGVGVVGFNAAMSTMARAAQWQMAVRLLDEMILHSNSSMESFRHSTSHASLLHVLSRNEDDADANENRDENKIIIIPRPDEVTFGTVLAACERSGEWEELLRIAKIARHNGVELDGMALTSVLHACQQLGLAEEALEYLDLMKRLGGGGSEEEHTNNGSAHSSNIVYTERRTRGRMRKGAKQSLRGPDGVAYRLAISACARASNGARWRDGIQLLNEMRESALRSNSTDEAPDVVAYTAAIAGCSEAGEYTHAMKLIQTMRREGIMPNVVTFSAVITACASASANLVRKREEGDRSIDLEDVQLPMSRALRLLEVMTSSPFMVRPNIVTYNAAIRACAEGLNLEGAFDLLRQLKEKGLEPTIVTYGSLMTACERVGNIEAASKVFRMVKEDDGLEENGIQANEIIYGAAISCCRKAGQPERALLLLRKMISEELSPNTATFNTVISALAEGKPSFATSNSKNSKPITNGNLWEKALSVYKVMKSKHAPPGVFPNRQTYNILIRNLAANLQPGYAESLLNSMRKEGFVPDVDLYTVTVRSYERCGNPMRALGMMEAMREVGYDFYDIKVLDDALKNAVKIVNQVGKGFSSERSRGGEDFGMAYEKIDFYDSDDDNEDYDILNSLKY